MNFAFWGLYIAAWIVAAYFNRPPNNTGPWNLGWVLPLILIGILGYAVLHIPR
jgi:hypothetical protein